MRPMVAALPSKISFCVASKASSVMGIVRTFCTSSSFNSNMWTPYQVVFTNNRHICRVISRNARVYGGKELPRTQYLVYNTPAHDDIIFAVMPRGREYADTTSLFSRWEQWPQSPPRFLESSAPPRTPSPPVDEHSLASRFSSFCLPFSIHSARKRPRKYRGERYPSAKRRRPRGPLL